MANNLIIKKEWPKANAWLLMSPLGNIRFTSLKALREYVDNHNMIAKKSKTNEKTFQGFPKGA